MLAEEERHSFEQERTMVEYMASFWNAEAVAKIRENRDRMSGEQFMDDARFEEFVESGDFKTHPALEKIREKYATNLNVSNKRQAARDVRLPDDKSAIRNIVNKDFEDK